MCEHCAENRQTPEEAAKEIQDCQLLLNDEQLEFAARVWCHLNDQDPDEKISHGADPGPDGVVLSVCLYSPRWTRIARDLKKHDLQMAAIQAAQRRAV